MSVQPPIDHETQTSLDAFVSSMTLPDTDRERLEDDLGISTSAVWSVGLMDECFDRIGRETFDAFRAEIAGKSDKAAEHRARVTKICEIMEAGWRTAKEDYVRKSGQL